MFRLPNIFFAGQIITTEPGGRPWFPGDERAEDVFKKVVVKIGLTHAAMALFADGDGSQADQALHDFCETCR